MGEPGRRRPGGGYRRWSHPLRNHQHLVSAFDRSLLAIGEQLNDLQGRRGCTLREFSQGTGLSDNGLVHIQKAESDPKLSTLVRIAAYFGHDVEITFRPVRTAVR